jgi:hypothetical protein
VGVGNCSFVATKSGDFAELVVWRVLGCSLWGLGLFGDLVIHL